MASSSLASLSASTAGAWYTVIETLADSEQADLPLLRALINRVPSFYTAAPEAVQERVALRYLEESAARGLLHTSIDASQSVVEVLCQNFKNPIPIHPSKPSQSTTLNPISDDVRQFISKKRSTLPKLSLHLLKESLLGGDNTKLPSTKEDDPSSSRNRLQDQEAILSPSSADLVADEKACEPLLQNNPTAVIANGSSLVATQTEPSGDDINQFIFKRRAAVQKTSQQLEESIPETVAPTKPSTNEQDDNLRSSANLSGEWDVSESDLMGSKMPFSVQNQNQCIVCHKEGHLLTCSTEGCATAVHESCITAILSSSDKEGQFYCPYCAYTRAADAYARAKEALSLAKKNLSFLKMEKIPNQQEGEKGKQPAEENRNADSSENGKEKEKRVESDDGNGLEDVTMLCRKDEAAKRCEADLASEGLQKHGYVQSGPGGSSATCEAAPRDEERENERRRGDGGDANINRKRHRPTPRYSNKVVAPQRRNKLPWSAEEEQALREGMQKFGIAADGRISWSAILDYGQRVFHRTRLPVDLKDKWRNMMKKEGEGTAPA